MGYKDMRGAMEEIIGEKKSQETDEEILQIYHQCEWALLDNYQLWSIHCQWRACKKSTINVSEHYVTITIMINPLPMNDKQHAFKASSCMNIVAIPFFSALRMTIWRFRMYIFLYFLLNKGSQSENKIWKWFYEVCCSKQAAKEETESALRSLLFMENCLGRGKNWPREQRVTT